MAKGNVKPNGGGSEQTGGDAGVLTDDALIAELGLSAELGQDGTDADEDAGGDNGGETDDEGTEEVSGDGDGDEPDDDGEPEDEESEDGDAESEGEEQDDAEEEDEESDEDAEEEQERLPRSVQKLQKRVRKLTLRAKSAEERVQALEPEVQRLQEELGSAKAPVIAPTEANPLSNLSTEAAVNERLQQMKALKRWCLANADGGEVEGSNGKIELTAAQVRERLAYAEDVLSDFGPARIEYLREAAKFDAYARKAFPGLFQSGSNESRAVEEFLSRCPEITKLPNWRIIVGDALVGGAMRLKSSAAKPVKREQAVKPAARAAVKPAAARPAPAKRVVAAKSRAKFYESGSTDDLAAAIAEGAV